MQNTLFKKGLALGIIILFVGIAVIPSTTSIPTSDGNTLYVDDDFNESTPGWNVTHFAKISDAINIANEGDTIFVYNGTYYEEVKIAKNDITLLGEDKNSTIIDGFQYFQVVRIYRGYQDPVENVIINGFTLRNCSTATNGRTVHISGNYNTISGNIITAQTSSGSEGIFIDGSENKIFDNSISKGNTGIYFRGNVYRVSNNLCKGNTISDFYVGIGVVSDESSNNNQILDNYIYNTNYAIWIFQGISTSIISRNIFYNNGNGIMIYPWNGINEIYHNNFINSPASDSVENIWDNGYPSGGNYWDDYTGSDNNGDGIGDTPYPIPDGSNQDNYPLMEPYSGFDPDAPNAPEINGPMNGKSGEEYTYTFVTTDPNGDDVYYYINWGDATYEEWIGPYASGEIVTRSHIWSEKGTYLIVAKAKDTDDLIGPWATLTVTMPKNKPFVFGFGLLEWLLERFPNAFPLLRYIFKIRLQ